MGLLVTTVEVSDFRCYEMFTLEADPKLTLLIGENAVGKTSLVEAIQLLTSAESFRRSAWPDFVRWGADKAQLSLSAEGEDRRLRIELDVESSGRRQYRVNGKPRRRLLEVAGIIHSVVFTPDDLALVKDSAEKRRAALDSLGVQLSRSYAQVKTEYERVLRQRNALLKEETRQQAQMDTLDELLLLHGSRLVDARRRLFGRLAGFLADAHREVSGDSRLEAEYLPSWEREGLFVGRPPEGAMEEHMCLKRVEERARRITLSGPHRDDILFKLGGNDARAYGSQGQQRTIALAWKLAEVMVITEIGGQAPVLLLDDVMSELDAKRRHALAAFVGEAAQTVMTTTNIGYFEDSLVNRAKVVHLG